MSNLMWFRRDLRVYDNPALSAACKNAADGPTLALFILTPQTWLSHEMAAIQVRFMLQNLIQLSQALETLNITLLIREVPTFQDVPTLIDAIVQDYRINAVYFNRQYEFDELKRDTAVIETLRRIGCITHRFDDQVLIPPEKTLTQQHSPFKVFTPFKRRWLELAESVYSPPLDKPKAQDKLLALPDSAPFAIKGFNEKIDAKYLPEPGESAAHQKLSAFCKNSILDYQKYRDFPFLDSTSHLSPYLALGVLSIRQCLAAVFMEQQIGSFSEFYNKSGPATWVSELIWRDFYKTIVFHYPEICKFKPFKTETNELNWSYDKILFQQWCEGKTGFPLIDAAMRQLNQTGWMHNRLRMLTAMFLSKILFIDWRWGERYFSQNLLDCDFSANNGGWQWCASTGTDAVPYFRIFNPILQSEKFDHQGCFIRKFCPELSHLDAKIIHDPYSRGIPYGNLPYPKKIIDYTSMRHATLLAFKQLKN